MLRETRESYGGDIERIANALRIRAQYLLAIEEGRYDRLPAPVYALGFVRAYAVHLGLDGEEAVRRFKQEASGFEISRDLVFPVPLGERGIPRGSILAAAVLLLLAAYGAWYYLSSGGRVRPERVSPVPAALLPPAPLPALSTARQAPTAATGQVNATPSTPPPPRATPPAAISTPATGSAAPPASGATTGTKPSTSPNGGAAPVLIPPPGMASPPPSPRTEVAPPTQTATLPPSESGVAVAPGPGNAHVFGVIDAPVRIVIRAKADCWVRVRDNGGTTVFQRLLKAGDTFRVPDRPGLDLFVGNASGLTVVVDGHNAPALIGKVRHDIRLDPDRLKAGTAVVD
ncbi:MAG: helix-turn-helix domain-containing protein [Alphaproteobacteria bacterium]|nr:helix-turn-helix domain-containing protein [Alphaproteobacteria bacterium]